MDFNDQERRWIDDIRAGKAGVVYWPTPETCRHPRMTGSCGIGTAGTYSRGRCPVCGYNSYEYLSPPIESGSLSAFAGLPQHMLARTLYTPPT